MAHKSHVCVHHHVVWCYTVHRLHRACTRIQPAEGARMVTKYPDCGLMIVSVKWNGERRGVSNSKSFPSRLPWLTHDQTTNRWYLNVALRQNPPPRGGGSSRSLGVRSIGHLRPVRDESFGSSLSVSGRQLCLPHGLKINDIKGADWWFRMLSPIYHESRIPHITVNHFPKHIIVV